MCGSANVGILASGVLALVLDFVVGENDTCEESVSEMVEGVLGEASELEKGGKGTFSNMLPL